ncbi:MAG: hypothetical protein AB9861_01985 [Methanosarcina sp.]
MLSFPDDIKKWGFSGQGISGGIKLLSKYGKLLLGAYILRRLHSGNSHEVSEHKRSGTISKYGKLILGAYLMGKLRSGKFYGTKEHEESTGGMLNKYGKLMLTTYAMKRLRSGNSHEKTEQSQQYTEPSIHGTSSLSRMAKKYGKLLMGAYLLRRFHHEEPEAEVTEIVETETYEEGRGSSMIRFNTVLVGALAGVTALYAVKRYRAKHRGYKIEVE